MNLCTEAGGVGGCAGTPATDGGRGLKEGKYESV